MTDIVSKNLTHVLETIELITQKSGRPNNAVQLLAVSKKQSIDKIKAAFMAGQKAFGENYVQEALNKQAALADLAIEWHFIGAIQSNKAKYIAKNFDWAQSVDRFSVAQALNKYRPGNLPPLNTCIQINIDLEDSKAGINLAAVESLAQQIINLPRLTLRGLMVIPKKVIDITQQRNTFLKITELFNHLNKQGFHLDTLSMGMSGDLIPAIQAGSTMVRIGTAIFGERQS